MTSDCLLSRGKRVTSPVRTRTLRPSARSGKTLTGKPWRMCMRLQASPYPSVRSGRQLYADRRNTAPTAKWDAHPDPRFEGGYRDIRCCLSGAASQTHEILVAFPAVQPDRPPISGEAQRGYGHGCSTDTHTGRMPLSPSCRLARPTIASVARHTDFPVVYAHPSRIVCFIVPPGRRAPRLRQCPSEPTSRRY